MDRVAGSLNERCNDLTHLQIEADTGELTSLEERVKRDTVNMLREAESYSVPGHYIDGLRRLLDQPEFSQGSRARELVELVEEQVLLEGIICETPPDGDVVVYIGGENRQVSLRPFGVIFCQYGIPSQASGTICVIGHAGALRAADNYVIPGSEHWQQSKFEAWPGDWGYECSHGGDPLGRWTACAMPTGISCPSFMPAPDDQRNMRVNCLLVASLVAGVVALGVGGVFLLVPFGYDDPGVEWGNLVLYALIGVPGAAAGFGVAWSVHRGRSLVWGIAALAFAVAHILLLVRVFLSVAGVGHLYAPTALVLLALSIWNLVLIVRPPRWTW